MQIHKLIIFQLILVNFIACSQNNIENIMRKDHAEKLEIDLPGSVQNPAFSPDGNTIVFTRFRNGYNQPPSDIYTYNLKTKNLKLLIANDGSNVTLPGTCWNAATHSIIFSSERSVGDQIYIIGENATFGHEVLVTRQSGRIAFEPTFSPDGQWIVFETHALNEESNGIITKYKLDGSSGYIDLTAEGEDCRQPNWSPTGDKILYQKIENGQWNIWVMNTDGSHKMKATPFPGNKTDAVFTHNGHAILFSGENDSIELANIFQIEVTGGEPVRITHYSGYDGAPSISPDGTSVVFESSPKAPEKSSGTHLWILKTLQPKDTSQNNKRDSF